MKGDLKLMERYALVGTGGRGCQMYVTAVDLLKG